MISPRVSYGWGMIPATVRIGASEWPKALWPKDGGYIVPVKAWVREAEHLEVGDEVHVRLVVEVRVCCWSARSATSMSACPVGVARQVAQDADHRGQCAHRRR